jgi:DNA-binding FrmR family transcriptional regulator
VTASEHKAAIRRTLNQVEVARATVMQLGSQLNALQSATSDIAATEATRCVSEAVKDNDHMRALLAAAWKDLSVLEGKVG